MCSERCEDLWRSELTGLVPTVQQPQLFRALDERSLKFDFGTNIRLRLRS
jgi:hypothetical protein